MADARIPAAGHTAVVPWFSSIHPCLSLLLLLSLSALLSLLLPPRAIAQCGGHPIGPSAGYVIECIALPWEPPTLLVGTPAGGLYRLIDGSPLGR